MKYVKYLLLIVTLSVTVTFIITLDKAKCSFSNFLQVKNDIDLKYAVKSCKFLYKTYIYESAKKIIYNTPFELTLRKSREKKYGNSISYFKKRIF